MINVFFITQCNEKQIVGIVTVVKEYYPDPTDKTNKFVVVDVIKAEKIFIQNPSHLKKLKMKKNFLIFSC